MNILNDLQNGIYLVYTVQAKNLFSYKPYRRITTWANFKDGCFWDSYKEKITLDEICSKSPVPTTIKMIKKTDKEIITMPVRIDQLYDHLDLVIETLEKEEE